MSDISYGTYNFPSPKPFVSISDEPFYVEGGLDYSSKKISLVGNLTGLNLFSIHTQKQTLISGLVSGYKTLSIDSNNFLFAKPISLNFQDSDLTTILPYSIEFECYQSGLLSKFYGIKDPVDNWSYSEDENRMVNATHNISAVGLKINSNDPLENAYSFVTGRKGFSNLTSFSQTSNNAFLRSSTENIDRFKGSYSLTENYLFSKSLNPISNSGIVSTKTQISYSKEGKLKISLNGTIIGSITGAKLNSGSFTKENAKKIVSDGLIDLKSDSEKDLYGFVKKSAITSSYDYNTGANSINFSFDFQDPSDLRDSDVINDYSVSVSASKDAGKLSLKIDGTVKYVGSSDLFVKGLQAESGARFIKVKQAFSGIDPYKLALEYYSSFIESSLSGYESSIYLNKQAKSESITMSPFENSISYSYDYDNVFDYSSGTLKNLRLTYADSLPVQSKIIKMGMNNPITVVVANRLLGELSVSATADGVSGNITALKAAANNILNKRCYDTEENVSISQDSISFSLTTLY